MNGQTVFITGASNGIGKELARLFAKDGAQLILTARNIERLEELKKELVEKYHSSVYIFPGDLSHPKTAKELFQKIQEQNLTVDILVNNAGFGNIGAFAETSLQEEFAMIQLNITSLTLLCKLFLKQMLENTSADAQPRSKKILNVASTAAFQPGPFMAVYFATKAYVLSFSEALANEVSGTNVTVSVLCPGPTATGFQERAFTDKVPPSWRYMDVQTVGKIAYTGLQKNKTLIIPGLSNKIFAFAVRLAPRKFVTKVLRKITKN